MNTRTILKILLSAILVLAMTIAGHSQTMKAFISAADNAFLTKDYYSALVYYSDALEFDEDRTDLKYKAAESARLFNAYTLAEELYDEVLIAGDAEDYSMATYRSAEMKQNQGKYEQARILFERYVSEYEGDDLYFSQRAQKEVKACEWALDIINNPDESIELVRYDENVNTPYSEFGAYMRDSTLYYSSLRFEQEKSDYNPDRIISKILKSESTAQGELIGEGINNNQLHTAHNAFNKDYSKIYYTICDYVNNEDIRCNIYSREIDADGVYGAAVKLPDYINGEGFTSTQPNIGIDKESGKEALFFVSDRPGGEGKLDIWYSVIDEQLSYSEPINLKDVNTAEDDITPFYHKGTKILYFSSEGYQGLGGFDIYSTEINQEGEYTRPQHLKYPTNSSFNDVYYVIDDAANQAHFSSNRFGSLYLEEGQEACCYDIYRSEFEEILINLDALTFDERSGLPLDGATVRLIDALTGEEIGVITNETANNHAFPLIKGRDYIAIAERPGYNTDTIQFNTRDIYSSTDLIKKLYLTTDLIALEALTFDQISLASLNGATVTLIDLSTGETSQEVKINPLSNDFYFNVERGKRYKLMASKPGFSDAAVTFEIPLDFEESKIIKKLYLGSLNIYLPVKLYFDNDRPDRRSISTVTENSYTDTYYPYIAKKEEFMRKYSQPFRGEQRTIAADAVDVFFEADVKGGYSKMNTFLDALLKTLESGQKLELSVKGFTSPRANNRYNLALGQRRISSVENELYSYKNGAFLLYLNNSGLTINDVSYGEVLSPTSISDKINDRRNSVYSVEASKERRVEIVSVKYL